MMAEAGVTASEAEHCTVIARGCMQRAQEALEAPVARVGWRMMSTSVFEAEPRSAIRAGEAAELQTRPD